MPQPFPALFLADSPGLDFLNSLATPVDVPVDWIEDGDGLLAWLDQAQLVPRSVLDDIRARALPGELNQVAAQVRDLREWFRLFVRQHQGEPLTAADLDELHPLNHLLERDEKYAKVVLARVTGYPALAVASLRRWRSSESLLQPIAEILANLVTTENFARIRACEGPVCTLLFADHTRGHSRRWCSMELCGNRAKQAAHRRRRKVQH